MVCLLMTRSSTVRSTVPSAIHEAASLQARSISQSPIGTMASAHVCATVPNFLVLEYHWFSRLDYWRTATDGGEIIQNGRIKMTDRPGIGLELNEEVARAHQYPGTTWFQ